MPKQDQLTYQNPVYPKSCPDPFVLKFCGEYWCYFTGIQPDGRCFGILHSPDLVHWQEVASAMDPFSHDYCCYWAPEVTYLNGLFYMVYSVGDEETMQIRVATAAQPGGPFVDSGVRLTQEPFAIDGHVFADDDGQRYLFYATDFLDYERIGTGTVVDRMLNPYTLAGKPRPVTRAKYDWQIYDPSRVSKGGIRWHTVEGPFVLKHNQKYYQMFSGGNWQNKSYGISYAVSDRFDRLEEWTQHCDGEAVKPVLRSDPETGVIGPGHNSVVRGPDNRQLYCIYHRWSAEAQERVLAVDPLEWIGDELVVHGPSVNSGTIPLPHLAGFKDFQLGEGSSLQNNRVVMNGFDRYVEIRLPLTDQDFSVEVSLKIMQHQAGAQIGFCSCTGDDSLCQLVLNPNDGNVVWNTEKRKMDLLTSGFRFDAWMTICYEKIGDTFSGRIETASLSETSQIQADIQYVKLFCRSALVEWAGFTLTYLES